MGTADGPCFDVCVRTRTADVTLVREVSLRAAYVVACHHAELQAQPVFIRNRATRAIETITPESLPTPRVD